MDLTQSLGWIINQEESKTYSSVFACGLRIPSRFSPCKAHSREMAQTSGFDPTTQVKTCFDCKMFDVANWVACLNGENGPRGMPLHEALSVSPQGALEISSVVGQSPSLDRNHFSTPRMVEDSDLNRLLSSFHRDCPKSSRNLPKWNLSVVLNELTKAPFEPMKDTDLKHLTLKTAFLLALASSKRCSEIHAWVANKVSNLGQWEKVALFPSSDFIAKNQLAREGSQSVSPVPIPALTTIVDRQFKEERTLCPVRALRYYLDRTKALRGLLIPSLYLDLDLSPQHTHLREEKKGAHPLQPSLQETIPGSRYLLPLQMFMVRSLIYTIFNCIMYLVFISVP